MPPRNTDSGGPTRRQVSGGSGIRGGLACKQFEVFNDPLAKPGLNFLQHAKAMAHQPGGEPITLSDEWHYARATVILES